MQVETLSSLPTISDVETAIKSSLEALRKAPLNRTITDALAFLAPEGYIPIVQMEDRGRRKLDDTNAASWNPETGAIVIRFERAPAEHSLRAAAEALSPPAVTSIDSEPTVSTEELQQCCEALAEAERSGELFVALSLFRDTLLPRLPHPWTPKPEYRCRVLDRAIEQGMIVTGIVFNPNAPDRPTTTVALSRTSGKSPIAPAWFLPLSVQGEPISTTIMRERGSI